MIRIKKQLFSIFRIYLLSFFYLFPCVEYVGLLAMVIILTFPTVRIIQGHRFKLDRTMMFWFFLILYNVFLLVRGSIKEGIYNCFLQILIYSFIVNIGNIKIDRGIVKYFAGYAKKLSYVLIIYNVLLLIFQRNLGIQYSTYKYAMRTVLYGLILIGFFAKECSQRNLRLKCFFYAALMFIFTERTMSLGLITLFFLVSIFGKFKNGKHAKLPFFIMLAILVLIPIIYITLFYSVYSNTLNLLVSQYTHKNLFSGRQALWLEAYDRIKMNPIFGYGYGDYIFAYGTKNMSVHNIYFYLLLQGGIINLGLVLLFLYSVYCRLTSRIERYENRLSISILLVSMFLGSFGLILFVNDVLYSMLLWTCVGIGTFCSDSV